MTAPANSAPAGWTTLGSPLVPRHYLPQYSGPALGGPQGAGSRRRQSQLKNASRFRTRAQETKISTLGISCTLGVSGARRHPPKKSPRVALVTSNTHSGIRATLKATSPGTPRGSGVGRISPTSVASTIGSAHCQAVNTLAPRSSPEPFGRGPSFIEIHKHVTQVAASLASPFAEIRDMLTLAETDLTAFTVFLRSTLRLDISDGLFHVKHWLPRMFRLSAPFR